MKSLIVYFLFSAFLVSAYSQRVDIKKLDSLFNLLENRKLATGSVAISINGNPVYQKVIGFSLFEAGKKNMPDINTKYRAGSISKMFTAVMIFQLIDEGKLSLKTNLASYFTRLPNARKITIEQMLYHRSGLHDYTKDTDFPNWMDKPKTHEEMLEIIAGKEPDFEPGSKADYCNTNYLLLSYIIERICALQYAQVVEQRIISKIGLKNTYYGKPIDINMNEASSYKYSEGDWKKEKETDVNIHCGAGAMVSTPNDLTVFIQNLFAGKLIKGASLNKMKTMIDGYGMGIFPYDFESTTGYGHNGRIEEFYSVLRFYPEKKLAVSYITNGILYPRVDILEGILKICFNNNYTIPFSKPADLRSDSLEKYVGTYSSGNLPFKVVCSKKNGTLIFEVGGKTMEVEAMNKGYFMNLKSGSFFEFTPQKGELQIKETDNVYYLQKEK